jgi:hypothetical protein
MNWTKTNERLPEPDVLFLAYCEDDPILDIFIDRMVRVGKLGIPEWAEYEHITHWMPLPGYPANAK